jgi:hypothetical protein
MQSKATVEACRLAVEHQAVNRLELCRWEVDLALPWYLAESVKYLLLEHHSLTVLGLYLLLVAGMHWQPVVAGLWLEQDLVQTPLRAVLTSLLALLAYRTVVIFQY